VWLDRVQDQSDEDIEINWKNFSLQQINAADPGDWRVWNESDLTNTRSLMASLAGEAAKKQGTDKFSKFFLELLTQRHGGNRVPLNDNSVFLEVAENCGLDLKKFAEDLKDESLLDTIANDHTEATEVYGAFGTPTFVFESGQTAYLKTFIPPVEESKQAFDNFIEMFSDRSYIGEVKRPQPPWPKGAV